MPEFYTILARKIIKISDFLMIFAQKLTKLIRLCFEKSQRTYERTNQQTSRRDHSGKTILMPSTLFVTYLTPTTSRFISLAIFSRRGTWFGWQPNFMSNAMIHLSFTGGRIRTTNLFTSHGTSHVFTRCRSYFLGLELRCSFIKIDWELQP